MERNTSSTANVSEDGSGHLNITPVKSGVVVDVGPDRDRRPSNFAAPAGGEMEVTASIKQPNPSSGLGYWPAFWMLGAGLPGQRRRHVGHDDLLELAVRRRDRHHGGRQRAVRGRGHPALRHRTRAAPATRRPGSAAGCVACSGCQTGYNTYSVIVNRTNTSAESITYYLNGTAYHTVTEAQIGTATWQAAVDHGFFLILDVAIGGGFPNGVCNCSSPVSATSSGAAMSVGYVAVYTTAGSGTGGGGGGGGGGGTSCTTTATADISADCYSASQGTVSVTTTTDTDPSRRGREPGRPAGERRVPWSTANVNFGTTGLDAVRRPGRLGRRGRRERPGGGGARQPVQRPGGQLRGREYRRLVDLEDHPGQHPSKVTGTHNVYLEFVSGAGGNPPFVSLHWFSFPAR